MFRIALPENATGNLNILINGNGDVIDVADKGIKENGKLIVYLMNKAYAVGEYNLTATYCGDDVYENSSAEATSNVLIIETEIVAVNKTLNLFVDDGYAIAYTLSPGDAVGEITYESSSPDVVSVDSAGNIHAVSNGSAVIAIKFSGNGNYTDSNCSVVVFVSKYDSIVTISPIANVTYGNNVTINYSIENRTGVKVTIDGVSDDRISITDDTITVIGLGAGNYTITVVNSGNGLYNGANDTKSFAVTRAESSMNVDCENITYGDVENIKVTLPADAGGNVVVEVDGGEVANVSLSDGFANITVESLAAGSHTVVISYSGDGNYCPVNETRQVSVSKRDAEMNVTVQSSIVYGDGLGIGVRLPGDVGGNVVVEVDGGEVANVSLSDGSANITVESLASGSHTVVISYSGDGNYCPVNETRQVSVSKRDAEMNVTVPSGIMYGDVLGIGVKLPGDAGGNVVVEVDGGEVANVSLSDGSANITVVSLAAGSHTVVISYSGDGNYCPVNETRPVSVSKRDAEMIISIPSGIFSGDVLSIGVRLPGDAGGNVVVEVDGGEVANVSLSNGFANITVESLASGSHTVVISYSGDGNYCPVNETRQVSVSKRDAEMNVTVPSGIMYGDVLGIGVKLPGDAGGNVVVEVDGGEVANVSLSDGSANITVESLASGSHTVVISYSDDDNYLPVNETKQVSVLKHDAEMNVTVPSTIVSGVGSSMGVRLPGDAGGNLTVIIGNERFTAPVVNGSASVKFTIVPVGNNNVMIAYSGDGKYAPIVKNTTIKVILNPKIVMKETSVLYTGTYSATVYGNDGKVAKNTNVVFYLDGKKVITVKTDSKGIAKFKLPSKYIPNKEYKISASAPGKSASQKVKVKQILKINQVKVKRSAKKLVLKATLMKVDGKYLKGKKITFRFNGKKIKTVKTNKKGVAKVTVKSAMLKKLKVGKKVIYKATYLKTTVQKTSKVKR